jgi:hypothetical protein
VKFPVCVLVTLNTGGGCIVVGSLEELLLVMISPAPETIAVFVTLSGALVATFTVSVMGG